MSKIQKFTTTNATITINDATTLQFNHNKCYKINAPYIFAVAYKRGDYVMLHELQGFQTDKAIEPKTSEEFRQGLHSQDNPYYLDVYDSVYEKLFIEENTLRGYDLYQNLDIHKKEALEYFHLFKIDNKAWEAIEIDFGKLLKNNILEFECFANVMIGV